MDNKTVGGDRMQTAPSSEAPPNSLRATVACGKSCYGSADPVAATTTTTMTMTATTTKMPRTVDEIRGRFIDYFKEAGHVYHHSSSVVLPEDPTLLFVNAGMNQFKPVFLGKAGPQTELGSLKTVVNSQKCIRAGGKHNDLDDVGKDVYHHTFFEMLGNWSFGAYFKERSIELAWNFLVAEMKFDPNRMYATYFEGDDKIGVEADMETKNIWKKYLRDDHILPGSLRDNFWEMGDVGPCGPCTEIHYDRLDVGRDASSLVNMDDPDVIEVWNIVFIQFDRQVDGQLKVLPKKHVDTGMGLERLVSIVQNKRSNYDTDIFQPIFQLIHKLSDYTEPYGGRVGLEDNQQIDQAYRIIADHCRTVIVAIADGVRPDNTGRGYVVRRILRRAIRYAVEKLKASTGFLPSIIEPVGMMLQRTFPEIEPMVSTIIAVVADEEKQFLRTLTRGRKLLDKSIDRIKEASDAVKCSGVIAPSQPTLEGSVAWRLYDTYGFPFDLTQLMCDEHGITVDVSGFDVAKQQAIASSKSNSTSLSGTDGKSGENACVVTSELIEDLKRRKLPTTDDSLKYKYQYDTQKKIYAFDQYEARVLSLIHNGKIVEQVDLGELCMVLLDRTCFYAEGGGQISDEGIIVCGDSEAYINDVVSTTGYVFHFGCVQSGSLKVGDVVKVCIDGNRRETIMQNHTGTHVLNMVLRQHFGPTVEQKGSLVSHNKLRFDITSDAITAADASKVQDVCNAFIAEGHEVSVSELPIDEAKSIPDIRTLPGEEYPQIARVARMGDRNKRTGLYAEKSPVTSVELCGGTHLLNSAHVQSFCLIDVEPIARGIKRIQALTGVLALKCFEDTKKYLANVQVSIAQLDKQMTNPSLRFHHCQNALDQVAILLDRLVNITLPYHERERVRSTLNEKRLEIRNTLRSLSDARIHKALLALRCRLSATVADSTAARYMVEEVDMESDSKAVNTILTKMKGEFPQCAFLLLSANPQRGLSICHAYVPKALQDKLKANEWTMVVASLAGGRSGGSAMVSQASGDCGTKLSDCKAEAEKFASDKLFD